MMRKKHRNLRRTAVGGVKQLYMILISIFMLFPLLWGLLTSLKPQDEIFTYPPKIFGSLTLENYQWVFEKQNLGMSILVTLGLAACSTVLGVLFATFAAYIFSRYSFTGKGFFMSFVVCPMLIPGLVNLIPLFSVYTKLGMVDKFWGLVLLYLPSVMPFAVMVLLNYLHSVPFTLEEAAMIDGANRLQRIWHINIPGILPTMVILLILNAGNIMNVGFEKIFLMQNDLNMNVSDVISTYAYRIGIESAQYSLSTTISLFNSVINCILLFIVNAFARKLSDTSLW